MLGRGAAFGHFPAAAANDVHRPIPPEFERAEQYGARRITGKSRMREVDAAAIAGAVGAIAGYSHPGRAATPPLLRRSPRRDDLVGGLAGQFGHVIELEA